MNMPFRTRFGSSKQLVCDAVARDLGKSVVWSHFFHLFWLELPPLALSNKPIVSVLPRDWCDALAGDLGKSVLSQLSM